MVALKPQNNMLSFKEFLVESSDLPTSEEDFRKMIGDFIRYGDFIEKWFQGDFMKTTFNESVEDQYAKGILDIRKKIPNYQPGSSTLYRIYHERHLIQFLNDEEIKIYNGAATATQKSARLSELLKNKQLSLNTGLNKLQSWTGTYENTVKFKQFLHPYDGEYYVTVESQFTSDEHLFFQPNQEKLGKYMHSLVTQVSERVDAYVEDKKMSKSDALKVKESFTNVGLNLIENGSGFDNGDESIVDTRLPRSVTVKDVTTF